MVQSNYDSHNLKGPMQCKRQPVFLLSGCPKCQHGCAWKGIERVCEEVEALKGDVLPPTLSHRCLTLTLTLVQSCHIIKAQFTAISGLSCLAEGSGRAKQGQGRRKAALSSASRPS